MQIVLVRPGVTDYDEQGRMKGRLDLPMNDRGVAQVDTVIGELAAELAVGELDCVYCGPDRASRDTADSLAVTVGSKVRVVDHFRNLDVGLWQGKLIEDLKSQQPKVYRRWQGQPETVCPPDGEMVAAAQQRVCDAVARIARRHRDRFVAIVVAEPLASLLQSELTQKPLVDLWQAECKGSRWKIVNMPHGMVTSSLP